MGNAENISFSTRHPLPTSLQPSLTQTVVSVMCQVESIIAGASVIARDVDTVVHTTCIILPFTLIHICGQIVEAAGPTCVPWAQLYGGFLKYIKPVCVCVCVCVCVLVCISISIVTFIAYKLFCI